MIYKGQLISKLIFGVFKFFQKTNENKSTWGIIVVKSNFFVRFLEELRILKSPFEINWPLPVPKRVYMCLFKIETVWFYYTDYPKFLIIFSIKKVIGWRI